jgi:hypothetical protein
VGALSAFYNDGMDIRAPKQRDLVGLYKLNAVDP